MQDIESVAVLGAGTMGRGIAHVAALAGYTTHLFDPHPGAADKAKATIEKNLNKGVELGKVNAAEAQDALARLHLHLELPPAVQTADLVIESAPEDIALKVDLLRQVTQHALKDPLLTSNTSALSITEMAAVTGRPDRFAGFHFFNPVHVMRLIELVKGLETSEETLLTLEAVGRTMGKEVVRVNESPGFVTSRINALIGNEAFRMLQEGVASPEDIDKALKLGLNHPMGPFEMVDLVGLDIRLAILEFLHKSLGETFRPTSIHAQYVRAGRLGRKTGKGIYTYDEQGRKVGSSDGKP